jgi:ribosomal protein S18 acetylase RimI-like enzyme
MTLPFDDLMEHVVWHALGTEHASLAISSSLARRYPADVVPLSAVCAARREAMVELRELLEPGEILYVAQLGTARSGDKLPECPGLEVLSELIALQMIYPAGRNSIAKDAATPAIEALTGAHAAEMVALTDLAFPGFFRPRTYVMGRYYGIRAEGELVAMAGERLALPGLREISAVCTHPEYRGRGYAARLIHHLLGIHSTAGLRSFLHVSDFNHNAIALYERLGFVRIGATHLTRVRRSEVTAA